MQRRVSWLLTSFITVASLVMGGCVVAPPRARVAVVAPARVWVPAHWDRGGAWVVGHWRYP